MVIELKSNYRFNENQREYENYIETLNKALSKIQNNKSPGLEMIIGFWYKQWHFYRPYLVSLFEKTLIGKYEFHAKIVLATTVLITKNENTKTAKNYRPIAWLVGLFCQSIWLIWMAYFRYIF